MFFASSFGGRIVGMSAETGKLVLIAGSRIELNANIRCMSAEPSGTFLVAITGTDSTFQAQIINIGAGGTLSLGPTISLPGNAEGSAALNSRIAIADSDHNKLNLYEIHNGSLNLVSSADTDSEPHGITFDAAGKHIYVGNLASSTVSVFSVSSTGELQLLQTASLSHGINPWLPGGSPTQIRLNAAGTRLAAVTLDGQITAWAVSSSDGTLSSQVDVDLYLYTNFEDVVFDPSGQILYALDTNNSVIYGYYVSESSLTRAVGSQYIPGAPATGITINAAGDRFYVLEMLSQVETFARDTGSGNLTPKEVVPVDLSILPEQIIRVPRR